MKKWQPFTGLLIVILIFAVKWGLDYFELSILSSEIPLKQSPFQLVDQTTLAGVAFNHIPAVSHESLRHIDKWMTAAGASVSVADINNDNYQDFYLTNSSQGSLSQLYLNNQDGTFKEIAQTAGVADVNLQGSNLAAGFFDCDNDGKKDLLLVQECLKLYRNKGDLTFEDISENSEFNNCNHYATAVNFLDFDHDGDLDIFVGAYFNENIYHPKSTKIMPESLIQSNNNAPIDVYENNGSCRFKLKKDHLGIRSRGWNFAIGFHRFDKSMDPAIWISNDFGNDSLFIWNNLKNQYEDMSASLRHDAFSRNGMSAIFSYPFNDEKAYVYSSQISSVREQTAGNLFWKHNGAHHFQTIRRKLGAYSCSWSWGAQFLDLDNNSFEDLLVVNGMFSTENKEKNRGQQYWYQLSVLGGMNPKLAQDAKYWPSMKGKSLDGDTHNCLFYNDGQKFVDYSSAEQDFYKNTLNARGVAYIDSNNDGHLDVIVANQGGEALFFRNTTQNKNNWIGFSLEGSLSNRDAIGAIIEVHLQNGTILQKQNFPRNAFSSQNDSRIHFGLGTEVISKIFVLWPKGKVSSIDPRFIRTNTYNNLRENLL